MIALQIAVVNRLVMSDSIPKEMDTLDPIFYLCAHDARIARMRMVWKRVGQGGHPQRGQIRSGAQEPPETKRQLCDHLAVRLDNSTSSRPGSRRGDVVERAAAVSARKQRSTAVPHRRPPIRRAVSDKRSVQRVAEHDFDPADVFVQSATNSRVPVVQLDRSREIAPDAARYDRSRSVVKPFGDGHMVDR